MILYVNSCVREDSRTDKAARYLLDKLGPYEEINLEKEKLIPLNSKSLENRTGLIASGDYSDISFKYAKQFAEADIIVIAAPYWDMSFPASLKTYIENIYVTGLVSKYGEDGIPVGLCRAEKLYYITTAGGPFFADFSYEYISALATKCFGIKETELIKAEMLDVDGSDVDSIMKAAYEQIDASISGQN